MNERQLEIDQPLQDRFVELFAALASKQRLQIVLMVSAGRLACQEILDRLDLSQPAISYHLAKLERAGILIKERTGARNCYRLDDRILGLVETLKGGKTE
jgi:DNA-binding transcriptional ArsR family regulator